METTKDAGMKVCLNGPGHMNKIAATYIWNKPWNFFFEKLIFFKKKLWKPKSLFSLDMFKLMRAFQTSRLTFDLTAYEGSNQYIKTLFSQKPLVNLNSNFT